MADINQALAQEVLLPGQPYFSPRYIVTARTGHYNAPYWFGAQQQVAFFPAQISAPQPLIKAVQMHTIGQNQASQVIGSGQAPAISYTGVEDFCS